MPAALRLCVLCVALTLLLALAGPGMATASDSSGGPEAQAAKRCGISGQRRNLGTTYVLSLSAVRVSCRRAKQIVRAYHRCRRRNGGRRGRCRFTAGYRCGERRNGIPSQFDARATCRRGGKRVTFRYTQNT